jgi:hypothetical protein
MVAAHDADTHHSYPQHPVCAVICSLYHYPSVPVGNQDLRPSTVKSGWRPHPDGRPNTF